MLHLNLRHGESTSLLGIQECAFCCGSKLCIPGSDRNDARWRVYRLGRVQKILGANSLGRDGLKNGANTIADMSGRVKLMLRNNTLVSRWIEIVGQQCCHALWTSASACLGNRLLARRSTFLAVVHLSRMILFVGHQSLFVLRQRVVRRLDC